MINYALPGTIVGIAYLIAFNDQPLALTGTATIIDRLLRLPLQPDRHPHDDRAAAADRPEPGRGVGQPRRRQRLHISPRDAAADHAGILRGPWRRVHPLDDGDQRHDLPGLDQLDADHGQDPGEHDRTRARPGSGVFRLRHRCGACGDRIAQSRAVLCLPRPVCASPVSGPESWMRPPSASNWTASRPFSTCAAWATSRRCATSNSTSIPVNS